MCVHWRNLRSRPTLESKLEPHPIRFAGSKSDADVFRTGCPVSKVAPPPPPPPVFQAKTERPDDGNFVSFGSFCPIDDVNGRPSTFDLQERNPINFHRKFQFELKFKHFTAMNQSDSLTAEIGKKRPDWPPRLNYRNFCADTATATLPDFFIFRSLLLRAFITRRWINHHFLS